MNSPGKAVICWVWGELPPIMKQNKTKIITKIYSDNCIRLDTLVLKGTWKAFFGASVLGAEIWQGTKYQVRNGKQNSSSI